MKAKHTPGPWKVVKPSHGHKTSNRCVQIGKDESYTTLEVKAADAKVMAAAPELLEALLHMHSCGPCGYDSWNGCDGGRAALAALKKAGVAI